LTTCICGAVGVALDAVPPGVAEACSAPDHQPEPLPGPVIESRDLCLAKQGPVLPIPPRVAPTRPDITSSGAIVSVPVTSSGLTSDIPQMWIPGQSLRVMYLGFSPTVRSKIETVVRQWTGPNGANLNLVFTQNAPSDIRIGPGRNESAVGREALAYGADKATMTLNVDDSTDDGTLTRHVLHEFGHALGWLHEHQSPAAGIKWNKPNVYAAYAAFNWPKADVDSYIFNVYSRSHTNYTRFDRDSIMIYTISPGFTLDGFTTNQPESLSPTDLEYARKWYPPLPSPNDRSGTLTTGDDCDLIDFRVDFDSNGASRSGITFSLGKGGRVTWYKGLVIPLAGGGEYELPVDNTDSAVGFQMSELDFSRPLGFVKAKAAGVHTRLGYTWPAMPAFPAKTSVQLTWKKDNCG
jgi:hypothetical protein